MSQKRAVLLLFAALIVTLVVVFLLPRAQAARQQRQAQLRQEAQELVTRYQMHLDSVAYAFYYDDYGPPEDAAKWKRICSDNLDDYNQLAWRLTDRHFDAVGMPSYLESDDCSPR